MTSDEQIIWTIVSRTDRVMSVYEVRQASGLPEDVWTLALQGLRDAGLLHIAAAPLGDVLVLTLRDARRC